MVRLRFDFENFAFQTPTIEKWSEISMRRKKKQEHTEEMLPSDRPDLWFQFENEKVNEQKACRKLHSRRLRLGE